MQRHKPLAGAIIAIAVLCSLAINHDVAAQPFVDGDVTTFTQGSWGADPTPTNGAGILFANYNTVYASTFGEVEVGIPGAAGFSIIFTGRNEVLTYLPAAGTPGPLTMDHVNPLSTASGIFGGEVLALQLNVDFSDAGVTLGTLGIPFGDLELHSVTELPALNGLTVRQYLEMVNTALGGGSAIYTYAQLDVFTFQLNASFNGGLVSVFANNNLRVIPEPAGAGLALLGLLGLGRRRRRLVE